MANETTKVAPATKVKAKKEKPPKKKQTKGMKSISPINIPIRRSPSCLAWIPG